MKDCNLLIKKLTNKAEFVDGCTWVLGSEIVGKVMSVLLNMLSRLVITFLPRSKHLSIS